MRRLHRFAPRWSAISPTCPQRNRPGGAFPRRAAAGARIASSFSAVMPGRASTRSRWMSAGALTTTVTSTLASPPVSNSSGISSTAIARRAASRRCSARRSASCTRGCTIASSRLKSGGSASRCAASRCRSTRPSTVTPGNAASIGATASPSYSSCTSASASITGMPAGAEPRRGRRLAHADRAGQSDQQHPAGPRAIVIDSRAPRARSSAKQRQQRQAEDREIVAVDALEQLDAASFELVGADAAAQLARPRRRGRRSRNASENVRIVSSALSTMLHTISPSTRDGNAGVQRSAIWPRSRCSVASRASDIVRPSSVSRLRAPAPGRRR